MKHYQKQQQILEEMIEKLEIIEQCKEQQVIDKKELQEQYKEIEDNLYSLSGVS